MPAILPLNTHVQKLLHKYHLKTKLTKQLLLLSQNPKHRSLNFELLQPKEHGIYSFRIDRKFRALCVFRPDKQAIEILTLTVHYH